MSPDELKAIADRVSNVNLNLERWVQDERFHTIAGKTVTLLADCEKLLALVNQPMDSIRAAVDRYNEMMDAIGGCTDGGCVVKRPTGMHTNGGCRCWTNQYTAQRVMRHAQVLRDTISTTLPYIPPSEGGGK